MFDEILPREEFEKLEEHEKRNGCSTGGIHIPQQIKKGMRLSSNTFYKIIDELNLPKNKRGGARKKEAAEKVIPIKEKKSEPVPVEEETSDS